jgi:hypothetical protein
LPQVLCCLQPLLPALWGSLFFCPIFFSALLPGSSFHYHD